MDSSHTQLSSRVDTLSGELGELSGVVFTISDELIELHTLTATHTLDISDISGLVARNYALILEISGVEESLETLQGLSENIDAFEASLNQFQTEIANSVYTPGENIDISGNVISLQSSIELSNIEVSNITVADTLTISGIPVYDYLTTLSGNLEALSVSFGDLSTNHTALSISFEDLSNVVDVLSISFEDLSNVVDVLSVSFDNLSTRLDTLSGSVDTLSSTVSDISSNHSTLNNLVISLNNLNFNDISDINIALNKYPTNMLNVKQIADLAAFIYNNHTDISLLLN